MIDAYHKVNKVRRELEAKLGREPTREELATHTGLAIAKIEVERWPLIGELAREERCTAVIVSHDPQSTAVADRVVRVRDGRVSEEAARAGDDEAIVVGKGGWLRLSEELLRRAGIVTRAEARLVAPAILLYLVLGGVASAIYLALLPFSIASYAQVKRRRAAQAATSAPVSPPYAAD